MKVTISQHTGCKQSEDDNVEHSVENNEKNLLGQEFLYKYQTINEVPLSPWMLK